MELQFDFSAFERWAEELGAAVDQVPFALSTLLNDAAFKARQTFISSTWPSHVQVYNQNFLPAALRVEKSTKQNLTVSIVDVLKRGYLQAHAVGGSKQPAGRHFAIPVKGAVRRTAHGSDKARVLINRYQGPWGSRGKKRGVVITDKAIFLAEQGKLHYKYSLATNVRIKADVPFYQDWEYVVTNTLRTGFVDAIESAMRMRR